MWVSGHHAIRVIDLDRAQQLLEIRHEHGPVVRFAGPHALTPEQDDRAGIETLEIGDGAIEHLGRTRHRRREAGPMRPATER
jgi:hypothetical protein